jgi:hypothetical protein
MPPQAPTNRQSQEPIAALVDAPANCLPEERLKVPPGWKRRVLRSLRGMSTSNDVDAPS